MTPDETQPLLPTRDPRPLSAPKSIVDSDRAQAAAQRTKRTTTPTASLYRRALAEYLATLILVLIGEYVPASPPRLSSLWSFDATSRR